jgi:hypothetical protein
MGQDTLQVIFSGTSDEIITGWPFAMPKEVEGLYAESEVTRVLCHPPPGGGAGLHTVQQHDTLANNHHPMMPGGNRRWQAPA